MAITQVTDENFDDKVIGSKLPVVVDFWAEWCGPCKAIAPALEDIAQTLGDRVKVVKINIDDNPSTPSTYNVKGIPMLMLFKDGEVTATKMGALPPQKLTEWVQDALD